MTQIISERRMFRSAPPRLQTAIKLNELSQSAVQNVIATAQNTRDSFFSRLGVSFAALNLNKTRHALLWSSLISHSANLVSAYQRKSQLFSLRADRMLRK